MHKSNLQPANDFLNLHACVMREDPYSYYDLLRTRDPVHWEVSLGGWFCTRYADVLACLKDKRLSAQRPVPRRANVTDSEIKIYKNLDDAIRLWMVFREPPEHSRIRIVCNSSFSQSVVDGMRSRIQKTINHLVDQWPCNAPVDLIAGLAYPLPARVLSPLFGISPADIPLLERWSDAVMEGFSTGVLALKAASSYNAMLKYFESLLNTAPSSPDELLRSTMLEACSRGAASTDELLANCVFLFLAGRDTTTNLIGSCVYTLLKNPDQLEMLRCDRSLVSSAIEEVLRLESPVQYVSRMATEDVEIGGSRIRRNENIFLSIGAANRDPAQFPHAHKADIRRKQNHHIAFIAGVHYCLGTHLARLEGQLALDCLLDRFSSIELVDEPEWKYNPAIRALKQLHILAKR